MQARWHNGKRSINAKRCDLISAPHCHLSERGGGTWQHLSGRWFVLFNGSILAVYLRSYNGHDLKSHLRIQNIDLRLEGEDLATLSLHTITWHDHDAPMKIRRLRFKHNDSPLWIPLQPLISLKRRSDAHAQFQNIINSLSLTRNIFLGVSNNRTFWHLNPWISCFPPLLDQFLRPRSV